MFYRHQYLLQVYVDAAPLAILAFSDQMQMQRRKRVCELRIAECVKYLRARNDYDEEAAYEPGYHSGPSLV